MFEILGSYGVFFFEEGYVSDNIFCLISLFREKG